MVGAASFAEAILSGLYAGGDDGEVVEASLAHGCCCWCCGCVTGEAVVDFADVDGGLWLYWPAVIGVSRLVQWESIACGTVTVASLDHCCARDV